jgi:hypothetical protein
VFITAISVLRGKKKLEKEVKTGTENFSMQNLRDADESETLNILEELDSTPPEFLTEEQQNLRMARINYKKIAKCNSCYLFTIALGIVGLFL